MYNVHTVLKKKSVLFYKFRESFSKRSITADNQIIANNCLTKSYTIEPIRFERVVNIWCVTSTKKDSRFGRRIINGKSYERRNGIVVKFRNKKKIRIDPPKMPNTLERHWGTHRCKWLRVNWNSVSNALNFRGGKKISKTMKPILK